MKLSRIARTLLGLEVDKFPQLALARYGDQADLDETWKLFEPVASTLVDAFYQTLDLRQLDLVEEMLDQFPAPMRGIGYEGAAMGYTLLDLVTPGGSRLHQFLQGPGRQYQCLVYIGAGLVLARTPWSPMRFLNSHDPILGWFVLDGVGFYDGFFNWDEARGGRRRQQQLHGYGSAVYDQGVGRSLWFSSGADVERLTDTINTFPADRRGDLWGGVGLACAYAAGVLDADAIETLRHAAGPHAPQVAVGTGMASLFRHQAGGDAPHTELACSVLWGKTADEVAHLVLHDAAQRACEGTTPNRDTYRAWRSLIADAWVDTDHARRAPSTEQVAS